MEIEVCRQCPKWMEFICAYGDSVMGNSSIGGCCLHLNRYWEHHLDYLKAKRELARHGRKHECGHGSRAYGKMCEGVFRRQYNAFLKKLKKEEPDRRCPMYEQHLLSEWNQSVE